MKTIHSLLLGVAAVLSITAFVRARCPDVPNPDPALQRQVEFRIDSRVDEESAWLLVQQMIPGDEEILAQAPGRRTYAIRISQGNEVTVATMLENNLVTTNPAVPNPNRPLLWAEAGYRTTAAEGHTGSAFDSSRVNYGQMYPQQYFMQQLNVPGAQLRSTGRGVAVAVIDTGVDASHPDLAGVVRGDGYNFLAGDTNTADVGDGFDSDGDLLVDEMTGHGTFVAGIIHLIAPEATILPIVALDSDGIGDCFHVALAIYYAIDHGVEIVNCSLGSTYDSHAIADAVLEAKNRGIIVVAAAGNRATMGNPCEFPALVTIERDSPLEDLPLAFGVTAVNDNDILGTFANTADEVLFCAPGVSVRSGQQYDETRSILSTLPGDEYGAWEGSSFSSAIVAGGAALIRAQRPDWAPGAVHEQMLSTLQSTAVNVDGLNPGYAGTMGRRINIGAAAAAQPPMPLPGDLDNDGGVSLQDLAILLGDFGLVHSPGDIDADGDVDVQDLAHLLGNFGETR